MLLVGNASASLSKDRRSFVLKKINSKGTLTSLAAKEFPDAKKNLFGDGFEERLKARSETAKTLFQAANVGQKLRFLVAAPPPSGAEHIEGAVHFEVLHGTASTEVTPAPEGLGAGATNPMQPKTSNSKSGKYSLHYSACRRRGGVLNSPRFCFLLRLPQARRSFKMAPFLYFFFFIFFRCRK